MGPANSDAEPTLRGFSRGSRVFARYTLDRMLGRGGMGVVWCAHDDVLGEDVALKFLPDAVRWDPGAYDDLKAETRRARQLTHPNIVRIHDFVEDAGSAAISMELVNGSTLTALRLAREHKVFEPADIVPWLSQLCAALDYAHTDARVVHRDLKPTNLMLTQDGRLKVADFGVARSMADSISRVSMMSAGTLVYMSPQQAMGEEPSPADDIYALGATLYELLTGKPPFHTGDVRLQLYQRKPDSIAARRRAQGLPDVSMPPDWESAIASCLGKEAAERPRCAGEIAVRLVTSLGAQGGKTGRSGRSWRAVSVGRRWMLAGLTAAAGLTAWMFWPARKAAPAEAGFPSDATRALAAWNFDGDARDGSGRGFDGMLKLAVPTLDQHGRIDRALRFNGSADVVVGDAPQLRWGGAEPFSAAVWVRAADDADSAGSCWRYGSDAVGSFTWGLGFDRMRPMATMGRIHTSKYEEQITLIAKRTYLPNEWHHLALVSDGALASLFVDGEPVASAPLGDNRDAPAPHRVELRFGRPERLSVWAFVGDLDDARLWRRSLGAAEIKALAQREPPPRFVLSQGLPFDTDDPLVALRNEFGPEAQIADWERIKRLHADDTRAWADELGLVGGGLIGWVQRGGRLIHEGKRRYFINRFDGTRPAYYEAHDDLGGMTLALGSWYDNRCPLMVMLPATTPRRETLAADAAGNVRRAEDFTMPGSAAAITWRALLPPSSTDGVALEMRLRDGRRIGGVCRPAAPGTLAFAVTDSTQPVRSRQIAATNVELEFTFVVRDGAMRFRAVTVIGGNLIFDERSTAAGLRTADLVALELSGLTQGSAQPGLASATLLVE